MLLRLWQNWAFILNGGLSFGNGVLADNISGAGVSLNTGAGNVDVTLTHNLQRIPVGYLPMTKSAASDIYTGSVGATKTQITLRGSVGGVTVLLFIL